MTEKYINYTLLGPPDSNRKFRLSKDEYLLERISGKSREEIAKGQNITMNTLVNRKLRGWKISSRINEQKAIDEFRRQHGETGTTSITNEGP
ncbi:hypothetical protein WMW72_35270 [Paenibacillus filicis]|uniref:Uncharacterized protein n=1 Tax=Paenibacillus filicis TaxID=669464 RepID=A0ABU9DZD3_9BACL